MDARSLLMTVLHDPGSHSAASGFSEGGQVAPVVDSPLTDVELLHAFVAGSDPGAFEAIVRRHGPLVMGLCRRIVHHAQDAEDAFQATFLVLAQKAAKLAHAELLGSWLYGVAFRVARRSRSMSARRQQREKPYVESQAQQDDAAAWSDLAPLLDEELQRMPQVYRVPILLCDMQGKSRREAALEMGIPEGTLSSRLARGRELLRSRLTRRGVVLAVPALAGFLSSEALATVPATLTATTANIAAGSALAPANVVALAECKFWFMATSKFPVAAGALLVSTVMAVGLALSTRQVAPPAPVNDIVAAVDIDLVANRPNLEPEEQHLLPEPPVQAVDEEPAHVPPAPAPARRPAAQPRFHPPVPPACDHPPGTRPRHNRLHP
jgi:RNA polymerase sigma factor (sigma-70 family)